MKKLVVALFLFVSLSIPTWAVTADDLIKHFEESQDWVKSGMAAFRVLKQTSDPRVADMYEFVTDKSYDYEGLIIDGSEFANAGKGPLAKLLGTIGNGVMAVIHKLATDEHKKLFKPTWIGFHSPTDKKVSNWFCLIMGNHIKTYLTRVDLRSKLDEIGADPLQMNYLDKNLFNFEVVKDLGNKAVLKMTPKENAQSNFKEALIEMAKLEIEPASTWYVTKISGVMDNGSTGQTEFGSFKVAAAVPGTYIGWSDDDKPLGKVPVWGVSTALRSKVQPDQKLFVFATQLKTTTNQTSKEISDYEVRLITNIKRLHINPSTEVMAQYITPQRLGTLENVAKKVVSSH